MALNRAQQRALGRGLGDTPSWTLGRGLGDTPSWIDLLGEPPEPILNPALPPARTSVEPHYVPIPLPPYSTGTTPPFNPNAPSSGGGNTSNLIAATINNGLAMLASIFGKQPYNPTYGQPSQPRYQYNPATGEYEAPGSQLSSAAGNAAQFSLQSVGNFFGVSPTTVVIGGLAALWLLFRQPPRRRNPTPRRTNPKRRPRRRKRK